MTSLRKRQNQSCIDYAKYHPNFQHCDSCHDDYEEYGYNDIIQEAPNGKSVVQCCFYTRLLDDMKRLKEAAAGVGSK